MARELSTTSPRFEDSKFHSSAGKWYSFFNGKPVITLGDESSTSTNRPTASSLVNQTPLPVTSDRMAFALDVIGVVRWPIPLALAERMSSDEAMGVTIKYSLSMSFFHLPSGRFFGSTWVGPSQFSADFLSGEVLCFWSRIVNDPECFIVIELVAVTNENDIDCGPHYGCGFSLIQPHVNASGSLEVFDLYEGTPKDLLSEDGRKMIMNPTKLSESKIKCRLICHEKLSKFLPDFIRENEIISANDPVVGLHITTIDGSQRVNFTIESSQILRFEHLIVNIPFRSRFENHLINFVCRNSGKPSRNRLLSLMSAMCPLLARRENHEDQGNDVDQSIITRRTLKVALHNGHSIQSSKWNEFEMIVDEENEHNLKPMFSDHCEVEGFIKHELCAVIFVLEFSIGTGQKNKSQTVVVGVQSFVPFLVSHDAVDLRLCDPSNELYHFSNDTFDNSTMFHLRSNDENRNEYNKLSFSLACYSKEFGSLSEECVNIGDTLQVSRPFAMIDGEESLCRSNDQNNENSVPDINKFDHYIGGNIVTGDASSYCVGLDHSYITDRRGDPCSVNDEGKIVESRLNSICNDNPPAMDKDTRLILSTEEYEGMRGESLLDCSVSLKSKENFLENRNPAPLPKQIFYAKRLRMPGGRYCEKAKLSERFADIEIARTEWKEKNI